MSGSPRPDHGTPRRGGRTAANDLRRLEWSVRYFIVLGIVGVVIGTVVVRDWRVVLVAAAFIACAVGMRRPLARSHLGAVPREATIAHLASRGWTDATDRLLRGVEGPLPRIVAEHLHVDPGARGAAWIAAGSAAFTGAEPSTTHAAAMRVDLLPGPVTVAESWTATSAARHQVTGRVTAVTLEPRVAAWTTVPARIDAELRPPDEHALGRPELAGAWRVHVDGRTLMVVPAEGSGEGSGKPPTLRDVADGITDAIVAAYAAVTSAPGNDGSDDRDTPS